MRWFLTYEIEEIMEDLIEKGLPENLLGDIEKILIEKQARINQLEIELHEMEIIASWDGDSDRMSW